MNVLIVTANFAPRGASPAVRTVHLTKYLWKRGHHVQIVTYDEATLTVFSPYDRSLASKVPHSVKVTRVRGGPLRRTLRARSTHDPELAERAKSAAKRHPFTPLLIPDAHVDSIPAFLFGALRALTEPPDLILSHGYPFSMHVVGHLLRRRFPESTWIADYGDPWTGSPVEELPRPLWRKRLDYTFERFLLSRADAVTVTTEPTKHMYERLFPRLSGRIHIAPMGFDPEDFESAPRPGPTNVQDSSKIRLVHTGRIYSEARDAAPFVRALDELLHGQDDLSERIEVFLIGQIDNELRQLIARSASRSVMHEIPWVAMEESIGWMKSADCLLLFGNLGEMQIPGKIYQYLGAKRPILLMYESLDDPTLQVVTGPTAIKVPNSSDSIKAALMELLSRDFMSPAHEDEESEYAWPAIVSRLEQFVLRIRGE